MTGKNNAKMTRVILAVAFSSKSKMTLAIVSLGLEEEKITRLGLELGLG
jgi:hypothetical protein